MYYYRGITYHSMRSLPKALDDLSMAIRLKRYHLYFWARSKVYVSLRNREAAIKDAELALRLKPGHKKYIKRLQYLKLLEDEQKP